jgi:hypothetical protein
MRQINKKLIEGITLTGEAIIKMALYNWQKFYIESHIKERRKKSIKNIFNK